MTTTSPELWATVAEYAQKSDVLGALDSQTAWRDYLIYLLRPVSIPVSMDEPVDPDDVLRLAGAAIAWAHQLQSQTKEEP